MKIPNYDVKDDFSSNYKQKKKQERFIARRFGVIVTPLSRD